MSIRYNSRKLSKTTSLHCNNSSENHVPKRYGQVFFDIATESSPVQCRHYKTKTLKLTNIKFSYKHSWQCLIYLWVFILRCKLWYFTQYNSTVKMVLNDSILSLKARGLSICPEWVNEMCCTTCSCISCVCVTHLAELCDFNVPSKHSCLDTCCPTKEVIFCISQMRGFNLLYV
jgi:hypothetical protein